MKENNKHWDDTDDKLSEKDIKVVIVKKKKKRQTFEVNRKIKNTYQKCNLLKIKNKWKF